MDDRDDSPRFHHEYTEATVAKLLGLREGWGTSGARHVTIVDLISWARDPGGDTVWYRLLSRLPRSSDDAGRAWMARRGPLQPDGEVATLLWDLLMAIASLPDREQAVVALTAFGFTQRQIGEVLHASKDEIRRILRGDPDVGRESVVVKITHHMNGEVPVQAPIPDADDARGREVLRLALADPRARRWLAEIREASTT